MIKTKGVNKGKHFIKILDPAYRTLSIYAMCKKTSTTNLINEILDDWTRNNKEKIQTDLQKEFLSRTGGEK